MKLKIKTAGLVGIVMGLFIMLLYLFIRPLLLNDAKDMDEESLRIDMLRVSNYIESEAGSLQRLNRDWAVWDDTYEFIEDQNQRYIDSNIMFDTFENNAINAMIYFNTDQELVFSKAYDLNDGESLDFSLSESFLDTNWEELNESEINLIIDHEEAGSVLIVSQQILTSMEEGPSAGVLVMGKILDNQFFERMKSDLAIDISFLSNEQTTGSLQTTPPAENKEFLVGTVPVSESQTLEVKKERKYYTEKLKSMNDLFLTLSLATLLLIFFVYYLLDLFVLSRISFLSGQLQNIDFDQPTSFQIKKLKNGNDEITDLETSVHQMLKSLEKAHSNVTKIAYFDYLTGLPNRFSLYRDFDSRSQEHSSPFAILFFDLDGFKKVNDSYGHSSGDELLQQIAERLTSIQKSESDNLYRIGGDEFVFLIQYTSVYKIIEVVESLMEEIRKEFILSTVSTSISSSVGISCYPEDGKTLGDLLHFADNAMYEAKNTGKNNYIFYKDLKKNNLYKHSHTAKEDALAAINISDFYLEYQPIVNVYSKKICRVEAVVRWNHPEYGVISPLELLPLIAEEDSIRSLSEQVLRKAIKEIGEWNLQNSQPVAVAVNISQLNYEQGLLSAMDSILNESGFPPDMVQIDMTESNSLMEKVERDEFIQELKNLGIRVALNDFVVSTSSLFQLNDLDIDVVNISRSFSVEEPMTVKEVTLFRGIFTILNDLGIEVVTDGIESFKELEYLGIQKISALQAYYSCKPVQLENLLEMRNDLIEKN